MSMNDEAEDLFKDMNIFIIDRVEHSRKSQACLYTGPELLGRTERAGLRV